jgi:hypothetical protein
MQRPGNQMRPKDDPSWMQLYTGGQFFPLNPTKEDWQALTIADVARGLACTPRYRGQSREFYSVAEHSVHVALAAPPGMRKDALMHDSPEGLSPFGDVIRPVKDKFPMVRQLEDILGAGLSRTFCFNYPPPPEVKVLDNRILVDEHDQLFGAAVRDWPQIPRGIAGIGCTLMCWPPHAAYRRFMEVWEEVRGEQTLASQLAVAPTLPDDHPLRKAA